ncbi:cholesterol transport system auxiliary component [Sphingomonas guangdongensis]|uniref:Cholesterol transport system auxiliary component n=1 Tax=Sphingomonas guangdongensis TaxID=1141890 RepID=A0A285QGY7_9SPHN|nr:ABC-type transport auxiliary lipoprotein family protein [Sphingomonas guangdongensis]SOB80778.1 cholesterol transport system auxiliary component [Sphingomonas guangdongensis]
MLKLARLSVLLPALALGGCLSFGEKTPPSLLTLTPAATLQPGATQTASAESVTVAVPVVPQEIATLRIPVRSSETNVAYLKDARWVEPVNRQFARVLSDTVATRTGRTIVGQRMFGEAGVSLGGELRSFGVDVPSSSAVVTFDATIVRRLNAPLERRRFEARVPVAAVEPQAVAVALNQAANQVAGEVADWVGR